MADATNDIAAVSRALNRIKTIGQVRAAAGAALTYLGHEAYPVLKRASLPGDLADSLRKAVDHARGQVEQLYRKLPKADTWQLDAATWAPLRRAIESCYIEASAVHGAASYEPKSKFADYLRDEATGVATVVGKTAAEVANIAGKTAGALVGGAAGGLGLYGLLFIGAAIFLLLQQRRLA